METDSEKQEQSRSLKDVAVIGLLSVGAKAYDAACYMVSNFFSYWQAIALISGFLVVLSVVLVFLHECAERRYGWDVLGLQELNRMRQNGERETSYFKRFLSFIMKKGYWWICFVGPWTVGPFMVALLLRSKKSWQENLQFILPGSLLSAVVWVTIWSGIGVFTWEQYVRPLITNFT